MWTSRNRIPLRFRSQTEGPLKIAVAIAAHDCDRRTERLNGLEDGRRADVAQMPDLICGGREPLEVRWQLIVSIGQDKDFQLRRHS